MDGKIIEILKSYNKREIKRFEDFLISPYHNKNLKLIRLFNELKLFYPDFAKRELTREYLHKKVYGKTKFNDASIRNLLSDLLNLAENFLVHSTVAKNKPEKIRIINDIMNERKVFDYTMKNLRIAEEELRKTVRGTPYYFYYKSRYSIQNLKINIEQNKEYTDLSTLYLDTRNNLLKSFMYDLLFLYSNYSQLQVKETLWEDMTFLENILTYLENNNYFSEPVLEIYYYIIRLQQTHGSEYYFRLKSLLGIHENVVSHQDKKIAYFIMYSYINDRINRNDYSLIKEILHLTEVFIKNGFSDLESGFMSDTFFMNTVVLNNMLHQFDESYKFIYNNYKKLKPGIRTNTFNYCMGLVKQQSGLLHEALELFSKTKFENTVMKLAIDNSILKIYYELGYIENCFTLIDSMNIYLRSNKNIRKKYSNPYLNFNKLFKKMLRLKDKPDKYELALLKGNISAENVLNSQKWLLKKIDEFENL